MTGEEVDDAVLAHLRGDSTLLALAPGGVWPEVAPAEAPNQGVFVILQLQAHEDVDQQADEVAYEVPRILAKAVGRDSNAAGVRAAYARVHALLQGVALTIAGYHWMDTRREGRVSYTEQDGPYYWRHRGGLYRIEAHPA